MMWAAAITFCSFFIFHFSFCAALFCGWIFHGAAATREARQRLIYVMMKMIRYYLSSSAPLIELRSSIVDFIFCLLIDDSNIQ